MDIDGEEAFKIVLERAISEARTAEKYRDKTDNMDADACMLKARIKALEEENRALRSANAKAPPPAPTGDGVPF